MLCHIIGTYRKHTDKSKWLFPCFFHETHINLSTPGALLLTFQHNTLELEDSLINVLLHFAFFLFLHLGELKSILCSGSCENALTFNDFSGVSVSWGDLSVLLSCFQTTTILSGEEWFFDKFKGMLAELCPSWRFFFFHSLKRFLPLLIFWCFSFSTTQRLHASIMTWTLFIIRCL